MNLVAYGIEMREFIVGALDFPQCSRLFDSWPRRHTRGFAWFIPGTKGVFRYFEFRSPSKYWI